MGVVEDVRATLQDFLAPQLRELRVRIDALEAQQKEFRSDVKEQFVDVKGQFADVKNQFADVKGEFAHRFNALDARFERLEDKLADRHEELVAEIRRTAAIHDLAARVAKLESERPAAH